MKKTAIAILLLLTLIFACRLIGGQIFSSSKGDGSEEHGPLFEIYPENVVFPSKPIMRNPQGRSKVAIIIDDIGYNRPLAEKFLKLKGSITFSVLPHSPYGKEISKKAHEKGVEVMLHLPMEPNEYPSVNPGPGGLLTNMSPQQIVSKLNNNIDWVPGVVGVNNHMGSKMTAVPNQMFRIFSVLKKRGLFFIDSQTTGGSMCKFPARSMQIAFSQRDVFLDHNTDPGQIRKQILLLVKKARLQGEAIGIGHPHKSTYNVLKEMLPKIQRKVILVPASEVVHTIG